MLPLAVVAFLAFLGWQRIVGRSFDGRWTAWIRPVMYLVPALGLVLVSPPSTSGVLPITIATIIGLSSSAAFWFWARKTLRTSLVVASFGHPPLRARTGVINLMNLAGGPIVQECFYRAILLWPLVDSVGPVGASALTSVLFTAEHRLHPLSVRTYRGADYVRQFGFGLLYAGLSLGTGSVLPSALAHFAFNVPPAAVLVARIRGSDQVDTLHKVPGASRESSSRRGGALP